jgi:hypothetical protein
MAIESIREMVREGENDPRAWIEYTRSLVEQPPETIWDVMATLYEVGGEHAVPALCLLAQEDVGAVGEAAIHTLGRVNRPAAAQSLRSILSMLPPDRRVLAERSLLKLQLKQVSPEELPEPRGRWRTLVGPPDGHGYQVVWFVHAPDERGRRKFLGLSIHERAGIEQAYGHHDIAPEMVPEPLARGQVHNVLLPGSSESAQAGARLLMLETEFEYGRRLAKEAQARTIAAGQSFPIEYRLMGPWLWQYRETGRSTPAERPAIIWPGVSLEASASLLYHPAFRGWFAEGEWLLRPAAALLKRASGGRASTSGRLGVPGLPGVPSLSVDEVTRLAQIYCEPAMVKRLQDRLAAMGEWLDRAGETRLAALALVAGQALEGTPPELHPLVRAMVELGLQIVVEQLRSLE